MTPHQHTRSLVRRIDALSLRERAILFVSAMALLAAVADALVLSPQFAQHKLLAGRMHTQNRELATLRERAAQAAEPAAAASTPRGRALAALQGTRAEQAALARELEALTTPDAGGHAAALPPSLPELLQRLLRRHERLKLLHLATVDDGAPRAAASGAAAGPARALELNLQGQYPDLLRYLLEIEAAAPGLRWSAWQLDAREGPPVLKLRVKLPGDRR